MRDKLIRFLTIILLSFMMAACMSNTGVRLKEPLNAANLHKTVYIDENFNNYEEAVIMNSLKNWECSTRGMVKFTIKLHYSVYDHSSIENKSQQLLILKTSGADPIINGLDNKQDDGRRVVGLYYTSKNDIPTILLPMDRVRAKYFKPIMQHEIGHSLGIDHITSKDAVMFRNIDQGGHKIMQDDLEAFCKSYWCNAEEMRACN